MFQIIFPMKFDCGEELPQLMTIMPSGWMLELCSDNLDMDTYLIRNSLTYDEAGRLVVGINKVTIKADEKESEGEKFWQAFGRKYAKDLNPFDLRFGVLYLPGGEGERYELDEFPKHSPSEVLDDASHYVKANSPFYISFHLGDWHVNESILTQTCQSIFENGELGLARKQVEFKLGNIENEETM